MRRRLERFAGQRHPFRATFIRFGKVHLLNGTCRRYMLIQDVFDARGKFLTHHHWMPLRREDYVTTPLQQGDAITFEAEVKAYFKGGRRQRKMDYGLCKPAQVERVAAVEIGREA